MSLDIQYTYLVQRDKYPGVYVGGIAEVNGRQYGAMFRADLECLDALGEDEVRRQLTEKVDERFANVADLIA